MNRPRQLLTIGHSYAVALNRRLAHELAREGAGQWEVTVAAPAFIHGELRPIPLEPQPGEMCQLVPVTAYITRRPHLLVYGRSLRTLLSRKWDLVHCWQEPYVASGFQVCRWTPREVPFVFWSAQNLAKSYPPPFRWFERFCLGRCAGWLACGRTTVSALGPRGYAAKPHRVIPLGVDTGVFRPDPTAGAAVRQSLGWAESGPPVVGYLGRFIPAKGLVILTQSLDAIRTPWRALFVGGGPMEAELRQWANQYKDGRVKVVTGVSHSDVPSYLNAMDMLVAPSQTTPLWKEQLGRMLIEAMACGVPVIGSDSGEIPYVIDRAGVVVPEADPTTWTATLAELLESPGRRADLAAAGLARAHEVYAWPVIARQHLEFFEQLLTHIHR